MMAKIDVMAVLEIIIIGNVLLNTFNGIKIRVKANIIIPVNNFLMLSMEVNGYEDSRVEKKQRMKKISSKGHKLDLISRECPFFNRI
jgi:hypothetical protein